jgi:hypothetical protein
MQMFRTISLCDKIQSCRYTAAIMPFSDHTMAWSGEHSSVVEGFIQNGGSPIMTQRAFRIRFALGRRDPFPIKKTVSDFRQTGSALKRNSTDRRRTATRPENVAAVRASAKQSPRRSARKHADALRLSDRSVRRILHRDLKMYHYITAIAQELSERDCETRTTLCRELFQNVPRTAVLLFTDEAHFHLSSTVNKQNVRYWANNNPQELHQRPPHSSKVTMWYAIFEFGVWGP